MTDRERFEAWWTDRLVKQGWDADNAKLVFYRSTIGGLTYSSAPTENAWQGWQAATAAAEADKWAAVRACVDVINCYSYVGDRSKEMLVAVKAEFPEAFK